MLFSACERAGVVKLVVRGLLASRNAWPPPLLVHHQQYPSLTRRLYETATEFGPLRMSSLCGKDPKILDPIVYVCRVVSRVLCMYVHSCHSFSHLSTLAIRPACWVASWWSARSRLPVTYGSTGRFPRAKEALNLKF